MPRPSTNTRLVKLLRALAVVAILVVTVVAISAFGGSSGSGRVSTEARGTTHLTLIERPISIFVQDNGKKGPSMGDVRTFHQELLYSTGKHAGTFDGSTVNSDEQGHGAAARESRVGFIQYSLSGGNIVAAGVYVAAPGVVVPKGGSVRAVVGGTGKYLGARGQVVQTPLPSGNIKNVLTLLSR
jgi:hypothetical protein